MKNINAVFKRVVKEMLQDKRTLVLMFIAPLVILTLINFLFSSSSSETAKLGVRSVDTAVVKSLKVKHLEVKKVDSKKSAKNLIKIDDYNAILEQHGDKLSLTLQNTDQSKKSVILQAMQQSRVKLAMQASQSVIKAQARALKELSTQMKQLVQVAARQNPQIVAQLNGQNRKQTKPSVKKYNIKVHYYYGNKDTGFFDTLMPIMISFIVFFFVFLITGMSLLGERRSGTLGRILSTPIKKGEIITGYILGYGLFAIVQTLEIVLFTVYVFKLQIMGSIWTILLVNLLVAFVALSLGLLLSAFAASEFQMMQFIPLLVVPQIFFAGIIPVSTMVNWLQWLAHIMPLYYAGNMMLSIIQQGSTFMQVLPSCLIMLVFGLIFMYGAIITMRKYREV